MGVRGLTTFIAQNSDKYMKRYELHDTYLVIDGNNLAAQIYKWHTKGYDCFGGDYDKYAQSVINFFSLLKECNVTPLIVYDGGYEDKKLKTVYSRVKTRIKQAKQLNCVTEGSVTVFPLFLRELFVEITLKLNLKVVRCLVEADYEMACIARKLNCPLLSYDSDFFIFDVEYIPFNTVILNSVHKLSKTSYKYLDCQIYRVENFLNVFGGLQKDCIPLLGVLLGNDYINIRVFSNFYKQLKLSKSKAGITEQQRRIKSVINWLQNETFASALRKILGRTRKIHRDKVAQQILTVTNNYICTDSTLLKYLNLENTDSKQISLAINVNINDICHIETDDSELSEESEDEERSSSDTDISINEQPDLVALPLYFEEKYKKCLYPACFIDIIFHNRYIFIPIVENYSESACHNISLDILSAIFKILDLSDSENLDYVLRNDQGHMKKYQLGKSVKTLPKLKELEHITKFESTEYISDILDMNVKMLSNFPPSWRLYILSIAYWIQNTNTKINECFICSLVMSAVLLKCVNLGECKQENKFLKKYQKDIARLILNPVLSKSNANMNPINVLNAITHDDGIMIMKEVISNFGMVIKLQRNPKIFDCNIIHTFAQFQSCALHIKYLNSLLNNPFEDYLISDFYNGTLLYNFTINFLSRPQLDTYLQLIMKNSPNIYNAFMVIKTYLLTNFPDSYNKNIVTKRKRKKKKKVPEATCTSDIISDEDDQNDICDINNRFTLLKLCNR